SVLAPGVTSAFAKGLEAYRQLPEEQRRRKIEQEERAPWMPRPKPPPGGLVLKVHSRPLLLDGHGAFQRIEAHTKTLGGRVGDYLWLTAAEWKSLVPAKPAKDFEYDVPEAIARRIFHYNLVDRTVKGTVEPPWPREHFRGGELKLRVTGVSD